MSRHSHTWRHWQRACPRCRQRRRSALAAVMSALVMGSLLALTFTGGKPAARLATTAQPAQAARSAGNPGSLYQLATATTQLTASETAGLTAHQRHLLHVAHLEYLAFLARLSRQAAAPAPRVTGSSLDGRLLAEAETQQGTPYVFGGDSPGGFDCSGLVYWAAQHIGVTGMPRDTFEMLAAAGSVLIPVSRPSPGDLAFFGSGHVELYVSSERFFGAQQTGTLVGFHDYGGFYVPTAYYAVR